MPCSSSEVVHRTRGAQSSPKPVVPTSTAPANPQKTASSGQIKVVPGTLSEMPRFPGQITRCRTTPGSGPSSSRSTRPVEVGTGRGSCCLVGRSMKPSYPHRPVRIARSSVWCTRDKPSQSALRIHARTCVLRERTRAYAPTEPSVLSACVATRFP